jgi:hypothetical protein
MADAAQKLQYFEENFNIWSKAGASKSGEPSPILK